MHTSDYFRFSNSIETSTLKNVRYALYRPQQVTAQCRESHNHGAILFDTTEIMKLSCISIEYTALKHSALLLNIRWNFKSYIWVASIERMLNMGGAQSDHKRDLQIHKPVCNKISAGNPDEMCVCVCVYLRCDTLFPKAVCSHFYKPVWYD